ncbi:MAG: PAS domain-containing protein [Hyphomicrobiales bacterium]|nr:PAS domain-containing protein [Hyphomicrobiales bacterium]
MLDLIYDAATEEELWQPALVEIAEMTGSLGGFVVGVDYKGHVVPFLFNGRMNEESHRTFANRHIVNPWSAVMIHHPAGTLVQSAEISPLPDLKRTIFFDEVLRSQNMAHNAMLTLARKDDFFGVFNLCRSEKQGPFEEEVLRFLSRLYPHLRRALLMGFRLDAYRALQRGQLHILDRLSAGMIVLDRTARVLWANTAAREMMGHGGPLRLRDTVLTAVSPAQTQRLRNLVDAALQGMPVGAMTIPQPQDGRLLTILISSLRSRDNDRFGGLGLRDAAALLVIHDPARPMDIRAECLMDAYGLTQAEARVAMCIAAGATVLEAAHRLNVSPNTIKTHLRKVFAKTGTTGQAELVRLMTSIGTIACYGPARSDGGSSTPGFASHASNIGDESR